MARCIQCLSPSHSGPICGQPERRDSTVSRPHYRGAGVPERAQSGIYLYRDRTTERSLSLGLGRGGLRKILQLYDQRGDIKSVVPSLVSRHEEDSNRVRFYTRAGRGGGGGGKEHSVETNN